jgi:hypothetical protein
MAGRTIALRTDNGLVEFSEVPTMKPCIQVTISDHDDAGIVVLSLTEAAQMIKILEIMIANAGNPSGNLPQGDMA